jgi:hypothetical protein
LLPVRRHLAAFATCADFEERNPHLIQEKSGSVGAKQQVAWC